MGDGATVANKHYFEIFSEENKTESYSFIPVQDVNAEWSTHIFLSVGQSEQQDVVTVNKQLFKLGKFSFWPKTLPALYRFEAKGSGTALKLPLTCCLDELKPKKGNIYNRYIVKNIIPLVLAFRL